MLTRRDFLKAGAAGALLASPALGHQEKPAPEKLPRRMLGKTGVSVPILGLGTVAVAALERKQAVALIHKAIDLGVTYIDTAPGSTSKAILTGYGRAQSYLSEVLKERRKEVFITTKCLETDGEKALALLRRSLKELGIDQVDLAYSHSIGHAIYDVETLTGEKGTMAALEQAKKDGLTRFVGVTGHNRPEKFVEVLKARGIDVMMNAVNIVDRHTYAFEKVVWPLARERKVGLVAMKVFGGAIRVRPCRMQEELRQASLRYALSVPDVALAVIGMGSDRELEQNVGWARDFKSLTAEEATALKEKTVPAAREWGTHLDVLDAQGEKSRPLIDS